MPCLLRGPCRRLPVGGCTVEGTSTQTQFATISLMASVSPDLCTSRSPTHSPPHRPTCPCSGMQRVLNLIMFEAVEVRRPCTPHEAWHNAVGGSQIRRHVRPHVCGRMRPAIRRLLQCKAVNGSHGTGSSPPSRSSAGAYSGGGGGWIWRPNNPPGEK